MNITYETHSDSRRLTFRCVPTEPSERGKFLAGIVNTESEIRAMCSKYLGHSNFQVAHATMPNEKS